MIHKVIAEVDEGSPLLVVEIPFIKGIDENMEALEQRIHEIEWVVPLNYHYLYSDCFLDTRLSWRVP
jgi:folate-dependent phosphoribosylglycinamide formyltransferase PurN